MMDFPIDRYRFYTNGKKVVAVSTYAGRNVRGTATCSDSDNFSLEKGKKLAAARCNVRIAEKRAKRAYKKRQEAQLLCREAELYYDEMYDYCDDAYDDLENAEAELDKLLEEM